jgi:hypothetical protein
MVESKISGKFFLDASITLPDSGFSQGDNVMQIHRFDIPTGGSTRATGASGAKSQRGNAAGTSVQNDAEGVAHSTELDQLSRQLDGISEVRPEVVAAAKLKLQGGDYLTRAAAEQTAASILSKDV